MGARKPEYLVRRGNQFYFRRRLPARLRSRFNQDEIKLSLHTDDPVIARTRCRVAANNFERLIQDVDVMPKLTAQAINQLTREYFAAGVQDVYDIVDFGPCRQRIPVPVAVSLRPGTHATEGLQYVR